MRKRTIAQSSVTDLRQDLGTIINRVAFGQEVILVSRHGKKPLAALIEAGDLIRLLLGELERYMVAHQNQAEFPQDIQDWAKRLVALHRRVAGLSTADSQLLKGAAP